MSAYDTYGNLLTNPETGTTAGVVTLAYDLADRTTSITPTGGTASTLALDALGRPRTRTTGASVDTYSYAGATNNVVRIANAGGSGTTTDSVVDPSGVRFGTKTGATVAWLLADLHGSVAVGLNQAGTSVSDALRYDGAGMTVATYPGGGSAATKSWKYQGRLDVAASGPSLYDFQAREMSPGLGAFTSNDTVLGSATNPRQLGPVRLPGPLEDPERHGLQHPRDVVAKRQPIEVHALPPRRQDLDTDHAAVSRVVDPASVVQPNLVVPVIVAHGEIRGVH